MNLLVDTGNHVFMGSIPVTRSNLLTSPTQQKQYRANYPSCRLNGGNEFRIALP